jgi:ketoreductase RED2
LNGPRFGEGRSLFGMLRAPRWRHAPTGDISLEPLLEGKVAIVTGSSSGIGEAIARLFAAEGASVVVNSTRSVAAGEAIAAELSNAIYVRGDVAQEDQAKALVQATLDRFGRLDVLVNNAGTTRVIPHHALEAVTDDDWQRILGTNVLGTWYVTRAAVPALKARRGSILNITSVAGVRAAGSSIPYAVSKAAVNHLTKLLANVLGPEIRVNAVAPGLIDTPWTADWDAIRASVRERAPLQRSGTPDDIARAALLLTASSYSTGEVLLADGGINLR